MRKLVAQGRNGDIARGPCLDRSKVENGRVLGWVDGLVEMGMSADGILLDLRKALDEAGRFNVYDNMTPQGQGDQLMVRVLDRY